MVDVIRILLLFILGAFALMMWGRLILDYAQFFARGWRPKGLLLVLCEGIYTVTDPPIKAVRKLLPPIRLGGIALDLAWMIVLVAVSFLQTLVSAFVR